MVNGSIFNMSRYDLYDLKSIRDGNFTKLTRDKSNPIIIKRMNLFVIFRRNEIPIPKSFKGRYRS
jgi:hypothetical protein